MVERLGRTSRVNKLLPIFTVNLVAAGQSCSGVKVISFGLGIFHVPRIAGDILTFSATLVFDESYLNAELFGPDTESYDMRNVAGLDNSRLLFMSGKLFESTVDASSVKFVVVGVEIYASIFVVCAPRCPIQ